MQRATWSALVGAAGTLGLGGTALYGVHGRGAQLFGPSVAHGASDRRSVALTFDDGPSPGSLAIAEYLEREGACATFFQCGANVVRHPEIARELASRGHEIGNHTFSHARLCPRVGWPMNLLTPGQILDEFTSAQEAIVRYTGVTPRLLRAPYGMKWYGLRAAQRRLGLLGVMWTVIGHDWEWPAARVASHVLKHTKPGGIICLHDGRDVQPAPDTTETLKALHLLVPILRGEGYGFETVSDLLGRSAPGAL